MALIGFAGLGLLSRRAEVPTEATIRPETMNQAIEQWMQQQVMVAGEIAKKDPAFLVDHGFRRAITSRFENDTAFLPGLTTVEKKSLKNIEGESIFKKALMYPFRKIHGSLGRRVDISESSYQIVNQFFLALEEKKSILDQKIQEYNQNIINSTNTEAVAINKTTSDAKDFRHLVSHTNSFEMTDILFEKSGLEEPNWRKLWLRPIKYSPVLYSIFGGYKDYIMSHWGESRDVKRIIKKATPITEQNDSAEQFLIQRRQKIENILANKEAVLAENEVNSNLLFQVLARNHFFIAEQVLPEPFQLGHRRSQDIAVQPVSEVLPEVVDIPGETFQLSNDQGRNNLKEKMQIQVGAGSSVLEVVKRPNGSFAFRSEHGAWYDLDTINRSLLSTNDRRLKIIKE